MLAQHRAVEAVLEAHQQPKDVLNAQLIWVLVQPGQTVDAWELYPAQETSFVRIEAVFLAQDILGRQPHLGLSMNSQSSLKAPQIAQATWSANSIGATNKNQ